MRSATDHGPCEVCRKTAPGLYWRNSAKVLDFGVPWLPPMEPDMTEPVRCDDCELAALERNPEYRRLVGLPPLALCQHDITISSDGRACCANCGRCGILDEGMIKWT